MMLSIGWPTMECCYAHKRTRRVDYFSVVMCISGLYVFSSIQPPWIWSLSTAIPPSIRNVFVRLIEMPSDFDLSPPQKCYYLCIYLFQWNICYFYISSILLSQLMVLLCHQPYEKYKHVWRALKAVLSVLCSSGHVVLFDAAVGEVVCESPNNAVGHFHGALLWSGQSYALDIGHLLLRGCTVRNTCWCYGLVVFAGRDSKLLKNDTAPQSSIKQGHLDRMIDQLVIYVCIGEELTTSSLTILAYLYSFSCCCVRNLRNPAKFTENSNLWSSRSSKVIDLGWSQSKAHVRLPISH